MIDVWCPSCRKRIYYLESTDDLRDKLINCTRCGIEFIFAKFGVYRK